LQEYRSGESGALLGSTLGWRWARDGKRITSAEQLLRVAIGVIHIQR
jgi:hypothetical protein